MITLQRITYPPTQVVSESAEVDARLLSLDLTRQHLWEAGLASRDFKATLTANNPPISHPHIQGVAICTLRDKLILSGFKPHTTQRNYATVLHPDRRYQIAVAIGTKETGQVNATPSNAWPKGPETRKAVLFNDSSLSFAGMNGPNLYVLLIYISPDGEMRMELSKPSEFAGDEFRVWEWRIIILDPGATDYTKSDSIWTPDIDVPVRRRSIA